MGTVGPPAPISSVRAEEVADVLARVRARVPLVQCLTNTVAAGFTANALLAVGASAVMVAEADEVDELALGADALLVNLGSVSQHTAAVMRVAAHATHAVGTPWVLDLAGVGSLTFRTRLAGELLATSPTVVRGSSSDLLSLTAATGSARGDSTTNSATNAAVDAAAADSAAALAGAFELAAQEVTTVAVSGPIDYITDGKSVVQVGTGHPLMTRVAGVGCVLGALQAACCAVEDSPLVAASAATAVLTVAAEVAADHSTGPGSYATALLDALYGLDTETLHTHLPPGPTSSTT